MILQEAGGFGHGILRCAAGSKSRRFIVPLHPNNLVYHKNATSDGQLDLVGSEIQYMVLQQVSGAFVNYNGSIFQPSIELSKAQLKDAFKFLNYVFYWATSEDRYKLNQFLSRIGEAIFNVQCTLSTSQSSNDCLESIRAKGFSIVSDPGKSLSNWEMEKMFMIAALLSEELFQKKLTLFFDDWSQSTLNSVCYASDETVQSFVDVIASPFLVDLAIQGELSLLYSLPFPSSYLVQRRNSTRTYSPHFHDVLLNWNLELMIQIKQRTYDGWISLMQQQQQSSLLGSIDKLSESKTYPTFREFIGIENNKNNRALSYLSYFRDPEHFRLFLGKLGSKLNVEAPNNALIKLNSDQNSEIIGESVCSILCWDQKVQLCNSNNQKKANCPAECQALSRRKIFAHLEWIIRFLDIGLLGYFAVTSTGIGLWFPLVDMFILKPIESLKLNEKFDLIINSFLCCVVLFFLLILFGYIRGPLGYIFALCTQ
jgi:hypothetical protein